MKSYIGFSQVPNWDICPGKVKQAAASRRIAALSSRIWTDSGLASADDMS